MKFLKVYIKNFKGIKRAKVIELDKGTTLLTGPNGFGKTTIFDAIELCLTGSLHRTEVKKGVTDDRKSYIKPFFQNDVNDEVTLKLLLENKCGKKLTIVRYLHKNKHERPKVEGKENKAHEFGILNLFTEDLGSFSQKSFDLDNARELTQSHITDFFEFADTGTDISSIYPIFNYLQQEETTFFLKKSEHDRKNSLGFLLRTDTQEERFKSINDKHKKLSNLRDFFNDKSIVIKSSSSGNFEYKKIFPGQEIDFDVKEPFVDVRDRDLHVKCDDYVSKINKLSDFIKQFTPAEFRLKNNSEKVKSLIINAHDFKEHYVLQNFLKDLEYKKLQTSFNDINNKELIEGFILKNIHDQTEHAIKVNKTIESINKFKEARGKIKDEYLEHLVVIFLPNLLDSYTSLLSSRNSLSTNLQGLNKTVFELKSTIHDLEEHFAKLQSKEDTCKCPYCGSNFDDLGELSISMKSRLVIFDRLTSDSNEELNKINLRIENEINKPTILKVSEFEKSNTKFDEVLIQKLIAFGKKQYDYSSIDSLLDTTSSHQWVKIHSLEELNKSRDEIQNILKSLFPIDDDVWNKLVKLGSKSYQQAYELVFGLDLSSEHIIVPTKNRLNLVTLTKHVDNFSKYVENYNSQHKYDPAKSDDQEGLFNKYFNNESRLFDALDIETLESKKSYLKSIVSSRENEQFKLNKKKIDKLNTVIDKLESLKEIYSSQIKDYKKEMVKRIQIPFFIYTAKILQNYQQGMGIFIFVKDDSAIRFIANGDSDHDIMHHLSSGQLAVVALAFCLAINKTFEISPNLKFLAIDDPVQEMDALNIHSFVDLVRSELSEDYQLIFSTHDDDNALFMKYKLEKVKADSVAIIDVQREFFPPLKLKK